MVKIFLGLFIWQQYAKLIGGEANGWRDNGNASSIQEGKARLG